MGVQAPTSLPLISSWLEEMPCYFQVVVKFQTPHVVSTDTPGRGRAHYTAQWGWESLLLTWPSLTFDGGVRGTMLQPGKGGNVGFSTWLLLPGLGLQLLICLWCLAGVGLLLFTSLLSCQAVPFLVLWLETADFSWGAFVCDCQCLGAASFSNIQSGYTGKKENWNSILCHSFDPEVLSQSAFLLSTFLSLLCLLYT